MKKILKSDTPDYTSEPQRLRIDGQHVIFNPIIATKLTPICALFDIFYYYGRTYYLSIKKYES